MQKFTRALTREIEVAGERLAVTLDEEGLTVRTVGSRRPPYKLSWAACVCAVAGQFASEDPPLDGELAEAIKMIKAGAPKETESKKAPAVSVAPSHPGAAVPPAEEESPVSSAPMPPAHAEHSIHSLLARVDRWLAAHRAHFHRGLLPGASETDLAVLQEAVGTPVPNELQELLRWHNGQSPETHEAFEHDWKLMSSTEVVASKKELDAQSRDGWHSGWIPFCKAGDGNHLVLDTTHPGHLVRAYRQGHAHHEPVASSLTTWLQDFVTSLEAGKYHEDTEHRTFHRAN